MPKDASASNELGFNWAAGANDDRQEDNAGPFRISHQLQLFAQHAERHEGLDHAGGDRRATLPHTLRHGTGASSSASTAKPNPPIQRTRSRARARTWSMTNCSPLRISPYDFRNEEMRATMKSSSASP